MKKNTLLFLLFIIGFNSMQAQDANYYKYQNAIKISPFDFAQSKFQMTYERYILDRNHSLLIMPAFILEEDGNDIRKGFEAMLQYRFFLTHLRKGEHKTLGFYNIGFYAGPYALGLIYNEDYQREIYDPLQGFSERVAFEKEVNALEGGVLIGMQCDITSRILFDFFIGGGIRQSNVTDTFDGFDTPDDYYYDSSYDVFDHEYTGVKPKVGFQLGFTF